MSRLLLAILAFLTVPAIAEPVEPPAISKADLAAAKAGKAITLVLVKDFLKIENTGGLVPSLEFDRYTPIADAEQFVLGRWVVARTTGGTELPCDIMPGHIDPAGNIIQTIRLRPCPPKQEVTVTVTTLVARRERPDPVGPFAIPAAGEYPEEVRPYLAATPMIETGHRVVREAAEAILAKTRDPVGVAQEIATLAKARTYLPSGQSGADLPLSARVLKDGGSCCASAVAAAAVFRACGIPAQVTYCPPPSYIHGITRFYIQGYGWARLDATSGTGKYPLMQETDDLALVRVFDTPIGMEEHRYAYAWPYQNNDADGDYTFRSGGKPCPQAAMYAGGRDALPFVKEPFPHLEPGSWSAVLGAEEFKGAWEQWEALVAASREALLSPATGAFEGVVGKLEGVGAYAEAAGTWMNPSGAAIAAGRKAEGGSR